MSKHYTPISFGLSPIIWFNYNCYYRTEENGYCMFHENQVCPQYKEITEAYNFCEAVKNSEEIKSVLPEDIEMVIEDRGFNGHWYSFDVNFIHKANPDKSFARNIRVMVIVKVKAIKSNALKPIQFKDVLFEARYNRIEETYNTPDCTPQLIEQIKNAIVTAKSFRRKRKKSATQAK